jgi:hypothetical protein
MRSSRPGHHRAAVQRLLESVPPLGRLSTADVWNGWTHAYGKHPDPCATVAPASEINEMAASTMELQHYR